MRLAPLYQKDRDRAIREGKERGIQQGIQQNQEKIAIPMRSMGMAVEQIANLIELSLERVRELQQQSDRDRSDDREN